ncbi:MAG: hypothetical protein ACO3GX_17425, partial [Gemmataceae bacterium]
LPNHYPPNSLWTKLGAVYLRTPLIKTTKYLQILNHRAVTHPARKKLHIRDRPRFPLPAGIVRGIGGIFKQITARYGRALSRLHG